MQKQALALTLTWHTQVSDIDGTMIGDVSSPDAFNSSHRFADYWENSASLAGSLLVYNTGKRARVRMSLFGGGGGAGLGGWVGCVCM